MSYFKNAHGDECEILFSLRIFLTINKDSYRIQFFWDEILLKCNKEAQKVKLKES